MNVVVSCSRCILNSEIDKELTITEFGICNHCYRYDTLLDSRVFTGEEADKKLSALVKKIKNSGKGKDYDCLVGVSGGVDSTYVAYLTKELGLRPLAVHFDNGWNSELAVKNVENVLKRLDIDLLTYVVDWDEFRDLQLAFLQASTPDGEVPSDHAINALLWQTASKHGIKYVISGMNFATESISVPSWAYGHSDWKYIKSVHKLFGKNKLSSYPHFNFFDLFYYNLVKGIRTVSILNYVDYNKANVMKLLGDKLGWVYYGGKHYESIYTRFYQGYILPKKFNIDKRYAHLSDLINAGQISRADALKEISLPSYPEEMFSQDFDYVCKKLSLSESGFNEIMSLPVKSFKDYPNSFKFVNRLKSIINKARLIGIYPK